MSKALSIKALAQPSHSDPQSYPQSVWAVTRTAASLNGRGLWQAPRHSPRADWLAAASLLQAASGKGLEQHWLKHQASGAGHATSNAARWTVVPTRRRGSSKLPPSAANNWSNAQVLDSYKNRDCAHFCCMLCKALSGAGLRGLPQTHPQSCPQPMWACHFHDMA